LKKTKEFEHFYLSFENKKLFIVLFLMTELCS